MDIGIKIFRECYIFFSDQGHANGFGTAMVNMIGHS